MGSLVDCWLYGYHSNVRFWKAVSCYYGSYALGFFVENVTNITNSKWFVAFLDSPCTRSLGFAQTVHNIWPPIYCC